VKTYKKKAPVQGRTKSNRWRPPKALSTPDAMSEKDKSGLTHRIKLKPPAKVEVGDDDEQNGGGFDENDSEDSDFEPGSSKAKTVSVTYIKKPQRPPFLIFRFLYRRNDWLQANGISPWLPPELCAPPAESAQAPECFVISDDEVEPEEAQSSASLVDNLVTNESDSEAAYKALLSRKRELEERERENQERVREAQERATQASQELRELEEQMKREQERSPRKRDNRAGPSRSLSPFSKRVKMEQKPPVLPAQYVGQTFDLTDD